jgi:hypothetical protein
MTGFDVIAYHQGELSYRFDKTATCPYPHPSSEWDYWHQGWNVGMKYDEPEWNDFKGFVLVKDSKCIIQKIF